MIVLIFLQVSGTIIIFSIFLRSRAATVLVHWFYINCIFNVISLLHICRIFISLSQIRCFLIIIRIWYQFHFYFVSITIDNFSRPLRHKKVILLILWEYIQFQRLIRLTIFLFPLFCIFINQKRPRFILKRLLLRSNLCG